jgi:hypothetical protein
MATKTDCDIVRIMLDEIILPQYRGVINYIGCYLESISTYKREQVLHIDIYVEDDLDGDSINDIGKYVEMLGFSYFDYYIYVRPGRL